MQAETGFDTSIECIATQLSTTVQVMSISMCRNLELAWYEGDIGACKHKALTNSTASLGVIGSSMKYLVRTISGPSLGASVGNISCSSELGSTSLRIGFADNGRPAECQLPLAIAFSFIYNAT